MKLKTLHEDKTTATQLVYEFLKENGVPSYRTTVLPKTPVPDCLFITSDPDFAEKDFTNTHHQIALYFGDDGRVSLEYESPSRPPGSTRFVRCVIEFLDVNLHDPDSLQKILEFVKKHPEAHYEA